MALIKFKDAYPNYKESFGDSNLVPIDSFKVYSDGGDQIGTVKDALVDEQEGQFRYLIVDTGFWVFGKNVLLPIGLARFDYDDRRVYVNGLTKEQVENLPEFDDRYVADYDYEEQVRGVYRPIADRQGTQTTANRAAYTRDSYSYDRDPALYNRREQDHQPLRLYEERLTATKSRQKSGEVAVGKHVETQTANVSVPVEKERVVIERNAVSPNQAAVGSHDFTDGEVARMDVYEETADVQKQAVVREEVRVRKEVERDTVTAQEQVRREELDINTEGRPNVNRSSDQKRRRDS